MLSGRSVSNREGNGGHVASAGIALSHVDQRPLTRIHVNHHTRCFDFVRRSVRETQWAVGYVVPTISNRRPVGATHDRPPPVQHTHSGFRVERWAGSRRERLVEPFFLRFGLEGTDTARWKRICLIPSGGTGTSPNGGCARCVV